MLLIISAWGVSAQGAKQEKRSYAIYFEFNKWDITTDLQRAELAKALNELSKQSEVNIDIVGWADKLGTASVNKTISLKRAESVKAYLQQNGIAAECITVRGGGTEKKAAYNGEARRADVTLTFFLKEKIVDQAIQEPKKEQPKQEQPKQVAPVVEQRPAVELTMEPRDLFSLRTNLLYWIGGVPNIGMELMLSKSVGILVNGGVAPWSIENPKLNWEAWFVSPEVRFYMGQQKRWFAGAQFIMGDYDLQVKSLGSNGSIIAGGVTGGYKLPLSECLDIDFSLGLGYGEFKYDNYRNNNKGVGGFATKKWVMPTQAGISLVWKIK